MDYKARMPSSLTCPIELFGSRTLWDVASKEEHRRKKWKSEYGYWIVFLEILPCRIHKINQTTQYKKFHSGYLEADKALNNYNWKEVQNG